MFSFICLHFQQQKNLATHRKKKKEQSNVNFLKISKKRFHMKLKRIIMLSARAAITRLGSYFRK